jgi:rubrerythrin
MSRAFEKLKKHVELEFLKKLSIEEINDCFCNLHHQNTTLKKELFMARQSKGSAEQQTDNSGSTKFICQYCGNSRGQFDHFCPSCGKSLSSKTGK